MNHALAALGKALSEDEGVSAETRAAALILLEVATEAIADNNLLIDALTAEFA